MSGLKWPALEGTHVEIDENSKQSDSAPTSVATPLVEDSSPAKAPAYPTSSRKGAKDWDTVAKEALKKEKKAEGKEIDDDAGLDDDEEGDPLNGFFKKLYKDASPDTRRAMMKSYIESNGTALSTNWEDVSKKTFPVEPPEGVEAKKWES
jgi:suppressor of G2 allele of SKP1